MSSYQPTFFKIVKNDESLNDEQLACAEAYESVRELKLFEPSLFINVDKYPTNHLLKWCSEVMAAYQLNCFDGDDQHSIHAKNILIFRFKQMYNQGSILRYEDDFTFFLIDWNTYLLDKKGIPLLFRTDMNSILSDETEFFNKLQRYRDSWGVQSFVDCQCEITLDFPVNDVKIGKDTAPETEIPSPPKKEIPSPPKKETNAAKKRKHSKMSTNARRNRNGLLVRGYAKMPHDRAVLHGNSPNFTPTIIINDMNSYAALDIEFP